MANHFNNSDYHGSEQFGNGDMPEIQAFDETDSEYKMMVGTHTSSDRKLKICLVLYFVILFVLMSTYIFISASDDDIEMHVYTSEQLSMNQQNAVLVRLKKLNNDKNFKGYKLLGVWVYNDFVKRSEKDPNQHYEHPYVYYDRRGKLAYFFDYDFLAKVFSDEARDIPDNGEVLLPISLMYGLSTWDRQLAIMLINDDGEVVKKTMVPSTVFKGPSVKSGTRPSMRSFYVDVPAAFMMDEENEVRILAFENHKPYEGTIKFEQINGENAEFPEVVEADKSGITSVKIKLKYSADFKITAENSNMAVNAGFMINKKNIHAELVNEPRFPDNHGNVPQIYTSFPGSEPDLTIDFFEDNAWIGRKKVNADTLRQEGRMGVIRLENKEVPYEMIGKRMEILYLRVSTSSVPEPENSQTLALVTNINSQSYRDVALFVLDKLKTYTSESENAAQMIDTVNLSKCGLIYGRDDDLANASEVPGCMIMKRIRDEALSLLASQHNPGIELRENDDSQEDTYAETHKTKQSIWGIVCIVWMLCGLIAGCIAAYIHVRNRRMRWYALRAEGTALCEEDIPTISVGFVIGLIVLFAVFGCAMFYMIHSL